MRKIALRAGLCLLMLCMGGAFSVQHHRSTLAKAEAARTATVFLEALLKDDLITARRLSWGSRMQATLNASGFKGVRDMQLLKILEVKPTTAATRPEEYAELQRMMSVSVRVKLLSPDAAGNPPGEYLLFLLTVQAEKGSDWHVAEIGTGP